MMIGKRFLTDKRKSTAQRAVHRMMRNYNRNNKAIIKIIIRKRKKHAQMGSQIGQPQDSVLIAISSSPFLYQPMQDLLKM